MTEFGKSPLLDFAELAGLGYRMVLYPLTAFRVGPARGPATRWRTCAKRATSATACRRC